MKLKHTLLCVIFFMLILSLSAQSDITMKNHWYEKSIAYTGEHYLIHKAFEKLEKENKLTIGVIGGSITAGAAASDFSKTSWGPLLVNWFRNQYPNADISFHNAGIGATNSIFGVHRIDHDLLFHKPDLVVVEFSVNDMNTPGTKMSYESMIRKILKSDNKPAVLALGLMTDTGENWQEYHIDVCKNYEIPYISYRDAIYPEIENGNITWETLYPDEVHPNDKGHRIIANLLISFLDTIRKKNNTLPAPVTANRYESAYVYQFSAGINNDWQLTDIGLCTSRKGKKLQFTIEASMISIMYERTPEKDKAPTVYLTVDNKKQKLQTYFENGWGKYMQSLPIIDNDRSEKHDLTFEYDDKPGKQFILHKILVVP